jgi:hypothetical protein
VDTSELEEVKARLGEIENRHKIDNGKASAGPMLRRTLHPDDGSTSGSDDDNHPRLKRRTDDTDSTQTPGSETTPPSPPN